MDVGLWTRKQNVTFKLRLQQFSTPKIYFGGGIWALCPEIANRAIRGIVEQAELYT